MKDKTVHCLHEMICKRVIHELGLELEKYQQAVGPGLDESVHMLFRGELVACGVSPEDMKGSFTTGRDYVTCRSCRQVLDLWMAPYARETDGQEKGQDEGQYVERQARTITRVGVGVMRAAFSVKLTAMGSSEMKYLELLGGYLRRFAGVSATTELLRFELRQGSVPEEYVGWVEYMDEQNGRH